MTIYDRLAATLRPAELHEQPTSYFSAPEDHLDPKLFTSRNTLRPNIRTGLLSLLYGFWGSRYSNPESWSTVYLAGSGVSYQWSAARNPGDLDVLLDVDWTQFRRTNEDFRDLSDEELRQYLNRELLRELWPTTSAWHGFETTWYLNERPVEQMHPYSLFNVTSDAWVVRPDPAAHPVQDPRWDMLIQQDLDLARDIITSYNQAYDEVQATTSPGHLLNAEITLRTAAAKGAMLFDVIHEGRKKAFGPYGIGFNSFDELRYKSAKAHGIISAFREMKEELNEAGLLDEQGTYGVELPNARDVLVRAAISRRYRG